MSTERESGHREGRRRGTVGRDVSEGRIAKRIRFRRTKPLAPAGRTSQQDLAQQPRCPLRKRATSAGSTSHGRATSTQGCWPSPRARSGRRRRPAPASAARCGAEAAAVGTETRARRAPCTRAHRAIRSGDFRTMRRRTAGAPVYWVCEKRRSVGLPDNSKHLLVTKLRSGDERRGTRVLASGIIAVQVPVVALLCSWNLCVYCRSCKTRQLSRPM